MELREQIAKIIFEAFEGIDFDDATRLTSVNTSNDIIDLLAKEGYGKMVENTFGEFCNRFHPRTTKFYTFETIKPSKEA